MTGSYKEYCQVVLDRMWQEAVPHPEDANESVWQGGLHLVVKDVAPQANPGTIMTSLQKSGAIVMIKRGGGPVLSQYWLRRKEYDGDTQDPYHSTPKERLEQRLNGLNNRLHKVERFMEAFTPMLLEISAERSGAPSPMQQIAEAFDAASELEGLVDEDPNSTQEDS